MSAVGVYGVSVMSSTRVTALSDAALIAQLQAVCADGRRWLVRLLEHLVEVEERSLHLKVASPSMFAFCTRRLGMSEGAAYRRTTAARLVRRFPSLLGRIERGEIHLSSLLLLREHLTEETVDELVTAASGKTKREVEELLARRRPKPDVPSLIRKLPGPAAPLAPLTPSLSPRPPARIEPLSPDRYKVQITASAELRGKLERATDLMRHRNPSGDLAVVIERAIDALLESLEKETRGKSTRPTTPEASRPAKSGHITRAVRRDVFARDGAQCTFADAEGRRCPSRGFLEVDHRHPRALGGSGEASNLRIFCRPHNRLHAEEVFGRAHVEQRVHSRQRKSNGTDAPC